MRDQIQLRNSCKGPRLTLRQDPCFEKEATSSLPDGIDWHIEQVHFMIATRDYSHHHSTKHH
jgi:hypothetical protein